MKRLNCILDPTIHFCTQKKKTKNNEGLPVVEGGQCTNNIKNAC